MCFNRVYRVYNLHGFELPGHECTFNLNCEHILSPLHNGHERFQSRTRSRIYPCHVHPDSEPHRISRSPAAIATSGDLPYHTLQPKTPLHHLLHPPPTARAAHSASAACSTKDVGHGEGETCTRVNSDVELFGEMQRRGIVPDVVTFNILMDGLSRDGKVVEACLFLELMVKRGYEPDVVTFCTLVKGLLGTGQLLQALQLHRQMGEHGGGCRPNAVTHDTLIGGLCKDKLVDDARLLFSEMEDQKIDPDVYTCSVLVHDLCSVGK